MAVLRFRINYPWLDVIDLRVKAVAPRHQRPIFIGDAFARQGHARPAPAAVVLQTTANLVRFLVVESYFVILADRDDIEEVPRAAVVVAPVNSSVTAGDDMV